MNNRKVGSAQEDRAAAYLQDQGMEILERNFRNRSGEIDMIGRHEGYLVFVEVKYRSGNSQGSPAEAVDFRKQRQICKVADYYRMMHQLDDQTPIRYDVVAILGEQIRWVQNAFYHIGRY